MVDKAQDIQTTNEDRDLASEVARLKQELANLREAFAERADDVVQGASRAAQVVTQPIRDHPGTSGLLLGGLVGLLVGIAIGQSEHRSRTWYDRYMR